MPIIFLGPVMVEMLREHGGPKIERISESRATALWSSSI
jgi:hypothetical protein